ncbi:MAG: hypothetical protein IKY83_00045, partial [Proteobacteria bacterium]|nr:hypothetical protein [Pseudomonadota bacterium]
DVLQNVSIRAQIRRSPLCADALRAAGVAVICLCAHAPCADASPADAFGLDAFSAARGMAVTASADPVSAAATNPARLIDTRGIELAAGVLVADDGLRVNDSDAGLDTYLGYRLGIAAALPLGRFDDRLFAGVSLHLPHQGLYDVENTAVDTPVLIRTGSHARRMAVDAAVAVRVWERISVAAGLYLMPDVMADVNIDFTEDRAQSYSSVKVDYRLAPTVGVYAQLTEGVSLGLAWRGAAQLRLDVPASIRVSESVGNIRARLRGYAYSEPHDIRLGARYDFSHLVSDDRLRFQAELDVAYRHYTSPIATHAEVSLYDASGEEMDAALQTYQAFDDAWEIRAALVWNPMDGFSVSAAYAFEKTPIPAQSGVFNVLDGDRHIAAFGGTFWFSSAHAPDMGVATAAQFGIYTPRTMEKFVYAPGNAGFPNISIRGFDAAFHLAYMIRFAKDRHGR